MRCRPASFFSAREPVGASATAWRRHATAWALAAILPWQAACTALSAPAASGQAQGAAIPSGVASMTAPPATPARKAPLPARLPGGSQQVDAMAVRAAHPAAHTVQSAHAQPAPVSLAPSIRPAGGERSGTASPVIASPGSVAALAATAFESITLAVGQAHLLDIGTIRRVAVGNGRVLQVNALDARQLLLLPESPGESTLHLWLGDGRLHRYQVLVTESSSPRVAMEINQLLGEGHGVRARAMGDKVVLEGDNPTEEGAWRAAEIVKRYPGVINLASRRGFEPMVNLEVKMIEVGRNALQQLGVRWFSGAGDWTLTGPSFGVLGDFKRSAAFLPGGAAALHGMGVAPRISPLATSASLALSLGTAIDLMVQNGDAVLLAEPRLSTRSGGKARFVAGGELPIPMLSSTGAPSIDFKEYGVRFEVEPTVNAQGVISARLHTEISSVNSEVAVAGVPGLRKQSADADVNLRAGETLVIAGMLTSEMSGAVQKLPGLGNLPVIGKLFKSRRFHNRETEMVVLITPRLAEADGRLPDARADALQQRVSEARQAVTMME